MSVLKFLTLRQRVYLWNFWLPFVGAGIRIKRLSKDLRELDIEMKLRWWNRNIVGVHFGGSLYAMTDPFYMTLLMLNLGEDYIVWDKAADIHFIKPGRGTVRAHFRLSEGDLQMIHKTLETEPKCEPIYTVQVRDLEGVVICEVVKTLYVRRKDSVKA